MQASNQAFEIWEDPSGSVRLCFPHSDTQFTVAVQIMKSNAELPKHNRPLAYENLLQISGSSVVSLFDEDGELQETHTLTPGVSLCLEKGQWHIHSNPFEEESTTLCKAEGDITAVLEKMRETFIRIEPEQSNAGQ